MDSNRDASESEESNQDLSLSCGSSSFDEGEIDEDENVGLEEASNIAPYQFEPYASDDSDGDTDENLSDDHHDAGQNEDRLQNNSWCTCDYCNVMPTGIECLCCKEIQRVQDKVESYQGGDLSCITLHPGFRSVCLDVYVLEVAYLQYRQQYGERPEQGNERHRYTAYRQFVRWCWEYLGKDVRVVLPSCAVLKIRQTFPDRDGNYTGFQDSANG